MGLAIMALLACASASVGGWGANDHCALQQLTQSTDLRGVCVCA